MHLNKTNIEDYILLSIDGELNTKQEEVLQQYLNNNTDAQILYNSFLGTKLPKESAAINYPQKVNLLALANTDAQVVVAKNKNNKTWYAVAAGLILLLGAYSVLQIIMPSTNNGNNSLVNGNIEKITTTNPLVSNSNQTETNTAKPTPDVQAVNKEEKHNAKPVNVAVAIPSTKNEKVVQGTELENVYKASPLVTTSKKSKQEPVVLTVPENLMEGTVLIQALPVNSLKLNKLELKTHLAKNILTTTNLNIASINLPKEQSLSDEIYSTNKYMNAFQNIKKIFNENKSMLQDISHLKKEDVELVIELPSIFNKKKI